MEIRKKTYRHTIYDTTLTKHVKDSVLACFFYAYYWLRKLSEIKFTRMTLFKQTNIIRFSTNQKGTMYEYDFIRISCILLLKNNLQLYSYMHTSK